MASKREARLQVDRSNRIREAKEEGAEACPSKKIIYDDDQVAKRAARRIAKENGGGTMRPYGCRLCGNVHLTSQRNRESH